MAFVAKEVLLQILSEASIKTISIGKTQLVKLLYLIEVEYYRVNGSRLTDLPWLFYHYGPYAFELQEILQEPEFAQTLWETKKGNQYTIMKVAEQSVSYGRYIKDTKTSLLIKKIVGQWASKPLEELLDYVYFETEPMQAIEKRGDLLDFTTIQKGASDIIVPLKASKETEQRVSTLRKHLSPSLKRISEQKLAEVKTDKDYQEAMTAWDDEVRDGFNQEVLKKIVLTIAATSNDTAKKGN